MVNSNNIGIEELEEFKSLFDAYYESIRRFVWYKTGNVDIADDIVQEVFLRLWQIRHKVNKETARSLLYTIANNIVISHYRHLKIVYQFENKDINETTQLSADEAIRMSELKTALEKVLTELPDGAKEVFLMNRMDNLSYEEIASRLSISVKAVEKRMSIALRIIREKLKYKI